MKPPRRRPAAAGIHAALLRLAVPIGVAVAGLAHGQSAPPPEPMSMPGMNAPTAAPPANPAAGGVGGTEMPGMSMNGLGMTMTPGSLGAGSMAREASGTSWQPAATPMAGAMNQFGAWSTMVHGYLDGVYDHQGGPRGGDKVFSESMLMMMAGRPLAAGRLTLRTMLSLDPLMGADGYPLLLQTGETANGVTPLIDRQHPHDLFMELAAVYGQPIGEKDSIFLYVGYPGEPALGPPTFMHRFSGMDDPAAPIAHHWLDATHITFGVVTAGVIHGPWKFEGSIFNGREPDQHRWDFDTLRLDSYSGRLSYNPNRNWSFQVSHGSIASPEQLEPGVNQQRTTASAIYDLPFRNGNWQTTFAWGRNRLEPGPTLDAFLLETAVSWGRHTIFARGEIAEKNELFQPPNPLAGEVFTVGAASLGYVYDIPVARHLALGVGVLGSAYALPDAIKPAYGGNPLSAIGFVRFKIR
jgi:hypothetical protein